MLIEIICYITIANFPNCCLKTLLKPSKKIDSLQVNNNKKINSTNIKKPVNRHKKEIWCLRIWDKKVSNMNVNLCHAKVLVTDRDDLKTETLNFEVYKRREIYLSGRLEIKPWLYKEVYTTMVIYI